MLKFTRFSVLIFVSLSLLPFIATADNYSDGSLLRAKGDIKVYLINNNIKRWVSSIEVFNLHNFKWQNVKVVPKKEITAIKEGEPILLEKVSPNPSPGASPFAKATEDKPEGTATPTPPIPARASPEALARQAKVNLQFPSPDYIRADWLVSHATSNYGRIGQRIVFKYSDKEVDKIENFRLYEKKPGDSYFIKIADFERMLSTGCEDVDIDGEWMMLEAGQCGYWFIQRTIPPARLPDGQGGRGVVAYLPSTNYSEGGYSYYVAGVDKDGFETPPSSEAKLVFLTTVNIFSPVDKQQAGPASPAGGPASPTGGPVSSIPDYFISISDNETAQNPLWGKQIKVPEGKSVEAVTYDGLGLDPTKKYKVYIYGHYRKSEYDPDYISIPSVVPEFWVKSTSSVVSFLGLLKALFLGSFDLLRSF